MLKNKKLLFICEKIIDCGFLFVILPNVLQNTRKDNVMNRIKEAAILAVGIIILGICRKQQQQDKQDYAC